MSEQGIGFFSALFRLITFYKWRKALGLVRAADAQFTGSAEGIADAYDLHRETLINRWNQLCDAVSQVETTLIEKSQRLGDLNKKEETLIKQREGALALAEKEADPAKKEKHKAAFTSFHNQIVEIEARQKELEVSITENKDALRRHKQTLTDMQREVENLSAEKADAIAEFVSNKSIVDMNKRMLSLESSLDRGPIEAVRKKNRELSAQARVTSEIAGTDSRLQDKEYERAGQGVVGEDLFENMLSARKAEREAKTGVKTTPTTVLEAGDGRPRI
ncbi:MAG: hypothetical protein Q8R55_00765 [Candidatus Taylorbacteria bacterium]|nr:hypothetical protein [Candidatus Taylorbacteria bacterium]